MACRSILPYTRDIELWRNKFEAEQPEILKKSLNSLWLYQQYVQSDNDLSLIPQKYKKVLEKEQEQEIHSPIKHANDPSTIIITPPASEPKKHNENKSKFTPLNGKVNQTGWYKTEEGLVAYLYYNEDKEKILIENLQPQELNELIELARDKEYLIACPGTVQGENGLYLNKKGVVSKWDVNNGEWVKKSFDE